MKIKLIRNHNLNKSRGHLVKVAKQIQGQTGAYQSHRWINPNKAIEVLKQDIGGVKATDELTFTNKQSGREISEKEPRINEHYRDRIRPSDLNDDVVPVLDEQFFQPTKVADVNNVEYKEEDNYTPGETFENLKIPEFRGKNDEKAMAIR